MQKKNNPLLDDNWGGRTLRSSGDLGLQKVLTIEHSALTRTTIGQTDLETKLCYNHILRPVAALASCQYGLPLHICSWVILILNLQEHSIITTNGKSKKNYKWKKFHSLHGIGQGSMAAPII